MECFYQWVSGILLAAMTFTLAWQIVGAFTFDRRHKAMLIKMSQETRKELNGKIVELEKRLSMTTIEVKVDALLSLLEPTEKTPLSNAILALSLSIENGLNESAQISLHHAQSFSKDKSQSISPYLYERLTDALFATRLNHEVTLQISEFVKNDLVVNNNW